MFFALCMFISEFFIAFAFSPDGSLSPITQTRVRVLTAAFFICGNILYFYRFHLARLALGVMGARPNSFALFIGLTLALTGFAIVETVYYSMGIVRSRKSDWVQQSPVLLPGTSTGASLSVHGEPVYDVTYTLEDTYARRTIHPESARTERELFFFGGSFTFGEGVEDHETLPSAVALLNPGWQVTNFGFPGHGPSHMLQRLNSDSPLPGNDIESTTLVYVFIPGHVRRVIGSMRVATAWGKNFPAYTLDRDEALKLSGTFSNSRPVQSALYALLSREQILRYYQIDFPLNIREEHLRHTVRVIEESRDTFLETFESGEFYVVLYPYSEKDELSARELIPYLEKEGIPYLDYTSHFEEHESFWLPHDGHPTSKAHKTIAAYLVEDLKNTGY